MLEMKDRCSAGRALADGQEQAGIRAHQHERLT